MVEEVQEYSVGLQKHLHKEGQVAETEIGLIPRSEHPLQSSAFPCEKAARAAPLGTTPHWSSIACRRACKREQFRAQERIYEEVDRLCSGGFCDRWGGELFAGTRRG